MSAPINQKPNACVNGLGAAAIGASPNATVPAAGVIDVIPVPNNPNLLLGSSTAIYAACLCASNIACCCACCAAPNVPRPDICALVKSCADAPNPLCCCDILN